MRLLIVDDEPLARMRLRTLLNDCGGVRIDSIAEAGSAAEALHQLTSQPADAVLLDIHMPGPDGIALARKLREGPHPPAVVFVTAHAEHALTAFELDAVDYLTKPVRRGRLQEALQRVALRLGQTALRAVAASVSEQSEPEKVLVVSDRGRVLRVPLHQVVYLKAEQKYVTLRTREHSYVLDDALSDLEARLGDGVVRIHRNALVARAAVRALERRVLGAAGTEDDESGESWAVRLAPHDEWLAVSRRQLAAVRQALESEGL